MKTYEYLHYVKLDEDKVVYIGRHGVKPREAYRAIPADLVGKALKRVGMDVVLDEVAEADRVAAEAAKEAAKDADKLARQEARARVGAAKPNLPTMTLPQLRNLVADILINLGM